MKKENGITLIALAITIIILLILASIATYSGISTIKSSKLNKFKQELEIMQAQVQILYEKYKDKDTIDIGRDISGSGREEEANTAFNGAGETEKAGYRLFDKEEIQKLGIDGIERDYLLDIMRKKVICLQGFEYNGTIYYTLEQLTDKNVIKDGIERGDVTFEYTTEELSDGGWKVTVYNIKFSKYVGKGVIQYKDTATEKVTTVEKNAKEGESYEFTISSEGNYEIIVTDAAEIAKKETIYLENAGDEIYNEPGLEEVAEKNLDLFLYEIIEGEEAEYWEGLPSKKARIIGMNPKYCNHLINGYTTDTGENNPDTNYKIVYNGETISDILVIPYQKEIDGEIYRITEVDISLPWEENTYVGYAKPEVKKVVYPNTVEVIENTGYVCKINYDVVLSKNLKKIGDNALSYTNIINLEISNDITSIGNYAFAECESLTSIEIPTSVTNIGNSAFAGCESLTSIEIPTSVTSIGNSAFAGCDSLTTIEIPSSVTSIESSTFYYCTGLTNITIPTSVTSIGNSAFYNCTGLTSITIPSSVISIGSNAFYGCSSLNKIEVDTNNSIYDSRDNCNAIIKTSTNELIQGCNNTKIPNTITSIGRLAFSNCRGLTNIEIPTSVTSIGENAFDGCSSLTKIEIPSSVTSIKYRTFSKCIRLTNITISNSVTSIGDYAFSGCSRLTNITIPSSVTSIGNSVFSECTRLTNITIPGSVTSMGYNVFNNWKSSQTINIQLKENEIPSTWSSYWKSGCSATINYL